MDNDDLDFAIWWSEMKNRNPNLWIFELHCIDGWNVRELAKRFGTSRTTVKRKLRNARLTVARYYIDRKIMVRRTADINSPQKKQDKK